MTHGSIVLFCNSRFVICLEGCAFRKHGVIKNTPTVNHVSIVDVLSRFLYRDYRGFVHAVDEKRLATNIKM